MDVVAYEPHARFLLAEGDDLFLDVNVHLPLVDTSIMVRLEAGERQRYEAEGRAFADALATAIAQSPDSYRERALPGWAP
ncbi:hypothetical protein ACIA5D_43985 [Actinoplanes sp. NPDC051513]|uniref:hypothetical protein n=1 Tax=Actinoplanes sp. NPDC051513 TaxID=3363908 RepID=UPI0037BDBDFE